jgi:hypothetical protein
MSLAQGPSAIIACDALVFPSEVATAHTAPDCSSERARVASQQAPSPRLKQCGVAFHQRPGIRRGDRVGKVNAAHRGLAQMRLKRQHRRKVQDIERDVVLGQCRRFRQHGFTPPRGPVRLDPAARSQQRPGARRPGERLVLAAAVEDQRPHRHRARQFARGRRFEKIAPEPGRDSRQCGIADVGARIAVHRAPDDFADVAGKRIGKDRFGLHDAGIAETGLAARLASAVDDDDAAPARLQMQRRADADEAGAKENDINSALRHCVPLSESSSKPGGRCQRRARFAAATCRRKFPSCNLATISPQCARSELAIRRDPAITRLHLQDRTRK